MRADSRFINQPSTFWAYVRIIPEASNYATRTTKKSGPGKVRTFSIAEMIEVLERLGRSYEALGTPSAPSEFGQLLCDYFEYRAGVINGDIRSNLMDKHEAAAEFKSVVNSTGAVFEGEVYGSSAGKGSPEVAVGYKYRVHGTEVRVPFNKQKGAMRQPAFLTGMVNLLVANELAGEEFEQDPRRLPVIDHDGMLYAALSRRMDGAYPSSVNPIAIWELKEYYYTTTFGSKISDAVYISALDGYERLELELATKIKIEHLLIVDARETWWDKGKSYLCRLIDILNMGHVSEILFGREVVEKIPQLMQGWVEVRKDADSREPALPTAPVLPVVD
ncbi:DUF7687 domain-containing protein [Kocuria turfanensis]|uniref:Uncharacterized protein n=1 Tax=Kocuria turfanensis TaxID=388357 RepID=A0A512IIB0_9MICC|nr:hypothetical protein [Kocuria turfanensis]GEO97407.1 hypothetical protein KTU01_35300 [Kocuria turfanensis]